MKLTQYSDYCLRVLMYLGACDEGRATISEISEHYAISRNHVMKIVYDLGRKGYLHNVRGKKGGVRMAVDPAHINLGMLIRDTEPDMALAECFAEPNNCCLTPVCVLRKALHEALDAFVNVLERYTVADLVAPRAQLRIQLGLEGIRIR